MNGMHWLRHGLRASVLPLGVCCSAAILVDTSPGTGAPPGTLGGYAMGAFPTDPSSEGTLITELTPPASAPVTGNLGFATEVEHMKAGSVWDTWSHGYTGDVYYNADHDLLIVQLPAGTLALSLYIQPNLKDDFDFGVVSGLTLTMMNINGNAGASYVGFYTDDPTDPLTFVYVRETSNTSDGFAVGEFMINVPEPGAWVGLSALGLGLWAVARRRMA